MTPMSKRPSLGPVVVLFDNTVELSFVRSHDFVEDVASRIHNHTYFELRTKVRNLKVEQGFGELLCCA